MQSPRRMRDSRILTALLCGSSLLGCMEPGETPEAPVVDVEGEEPERPATLYMPIESSGLASQAEFEVAAAPGGPPLIVFLNRNGGTYRGGANDPVTNTSSIVAGQGLRSATLPPYRGGDAAWAEVYKCVTNEFARFNVQVTDKEPASGPYIEAVFGGSGQEIGMRAGGVAPIDPRNCSLLSSAIVFIFTEVLGSSPETHCEVAAQEIGHAMSLDHEMLASDPMTYLGFRGLQTFQDANAPCGEYSNRACICNRPSQNSVQVLFQKLGARGNNPPPPPPPPNPTDTTKPTVAITSPAEHATLDANTRIQVVATATDNVGVTGVDLIWKFNGATLPCPGQGNGWSCTKSGTTYTWTLNVGSGDRRFQVRAKDAAGNESVTAERLIHLGSEPPPPDTAPVVDMTSPTEGQVFAQGELVYIKADVTDPDGVNGVRATWVYPTGQVTWPLSQLGGNTWGITVRVSSTAVSGPREIIIQATDNAGKATRVTRKVSIQ